VDNPELLLKPGMTANVTIVTARRDNVARLPVEALRFAPPNTPLKDANAVDGNQASRQARVWVPDGGGITPVSVTIGLDDGNQVELVDGNLHEGDPVVVDQITTGGKKSTANTSPLAGGPRMR
jgi:HlyD family secretion protein